MARMEQQWTDQQVEQMIGNLLRGGVIVAAAVVLVGGIIYLSRYGALLPDYRVFRGEPTDLRSVSGIIKDVFSLRSRAVIQLGLLLLVATPVARVAFSVLTFARERDRAYVIVTVSVLAALTYSIAGGQL
ncbi:MAG TPA: DUF1634 domain-containing protein [Blastocatellia bacterium]|nr:DUF1634 domain-containing protein [Blastocatellia bacterium]